MNSYALASNNPFAVEEIAAQDQGAAGSKEHVDQVKSKSRRSLGIMFMSTLETLPVLGKVLDRKVHID